MWVAFNMSALFTISLLLLLTSHPCSSKMFRCTPIDPEGHELAILTVCTVNMSLQTGQKIVWSKSSEVIGECVTESPFVPSKLENVQRYLSHCTCSSNKGYRVSI